MKPPPSKQTKKTDLQLLKALLSCPVGKLSPAEKSSFQAMYDRVATGMQIGLSPKQRAWVEGAYLKLDLDKERAFIPQRVEVKDKSLLSPLDASPMPLKPPGRG